MVNASALTNKKVLTSDAYFLGVVEGIEVDTENWLITNVRILLSTQAINDLQLEPPILWDVVVTLPVRFIKGFGENISLHVPFSEIAAIVKPKKTEQLKIAPT